MPNAKPSPKGTNTQKLKHLVHLSAPCFKNMMKRVGCFFRRHGQKDDHPRITHWENANFRDPPASQFNGHVKPQIKIIPLPQSVNPLSFKVFLEEKYAALEADEEAFKSFIQKYMGLVIMRFRRWRIDWGRGDPISQKDWTKPLIRDIFCASKSLENDFCKKNAHATVKNWCDYHINPLAEQRLEPIFHDEPHNFWHHVKIQTLQLVGYIKVAAYIVATSSSIYFGPVVLVNDKLQDGDHSQGMTQQPDSTRPYNRKPRSPGQSITHPQNPAPSPKPKVSKTPHSPSTPLIPSQQYQAIMSLVQKGDIQYQKGNDFRLGANAPLSAFDAYSEAFIKLAQESSRDTLVFKVGVKLKELLEKSKARVAQNLGQGYGPVYSKIDSLIKAGQLKFNPKRSLNTPGSISSFENYRDAIVQSHMYQLKNDALGDACAKMIQMIDAYLK